MFNRNALIAVYAKSIFKQPDLSIQIFANNTNGFFLAEMLLNIAVKLMSDYCYLQT